MLTHSGHACGPHSGAVDGMPAPAETLISGSHGAAICAREQMTFYVLSRV
jgi:hypothetical protein